MFESLSDRFDGILGRLRGKGRLSESDVAEAMREIRLALLEADVHLNVVKRFVDRMQARCLEAEVTESLTPGQQVVKAVNLPYVVTPVAHHHPENEQQLPGHRSGEAETDVASIV